MNFPLKLDVIKAKFSDLSSVPRKTNDKNSIIKKIILDCDIEHKKVKDTNYVVGLDFQFQISPRRGVRYLKTRDLYGLIFLPEHDLLVILGKDTAMAEITSFITKILYSDSKIRFMFSHVNFNSDSLINIIKKLRIDDPDSWCDEYRGTHGAVKYQGKKTKSNFSLGEGHCVLDDREAIDAMNNSTSINPKYRFYKCPKFISKTYDSPKAISFNGKNGSISCSISQDFDSWYKFISEFLIKELVW